MSRRRFFSMLAVFVFLSVTVMSLNNPTPVRAASTNFISNSNDKNWEEHEGWTDFITRSGDKLKDGAKEFKFIGVNAMVLGSGDDSTVWRLQDPFTQEDYFKTANQMGFTALRSYTLAVKRATDPADIKKHYMGPGSYGEDAFVVMDRALQLANKYHVRLIIPLIDKYKYANGGTADFAAFRGMPESAFWTDETVKSDFKNFINYVVNRTNTLTGVKYKDDKAILCWETGNEIWPEYSDWTAEMAAYIKSVDPNHLVMDGRYSYSGNIDWSIDDKNVDILNNHYYTGDYAARCDADRDYCRGKRPFIVGEFGNNTVQALQALTDRVVSNGTTGALYWAMRGHRPEGGYYWHNYNWQALHWPGFPAMESEYGEISICDDLRSKAYQIRGLTLPDLPVPDAPGLLAISDVNHINWQGSAGAQRYDVERATSIDGPWTTVAQDVYDGNIHSISPYTLFSDTTAPAGTALYYRVKAKNRNGDASGYSNVAYVYNPAGPTIVEDDSTSVVKVGTWSRQSYANAHGGSYTASNITGNYMDLTFDSATIKFYIKKGSGSGMADIYIDDMTTPAATIDAYSPYDQWQALVYQNTALSAGTHTIRVKVKGTRNASSSNYYIAVDYFEYM